MMHRSVCIGTVCSGRNSEGRLLEDAVVAGGTGSGDVVVGAHEA